jgi:hypothetical protein
MLAIVEKFLDVPMVGYLKVDALTGMGEESLGLVSTIWRASSLVSDIVIGGAQGIPVALGSYAGLGNS